VTSWRDKQGSSWPGFWILAGINLAVLGLALARVGPFDWGEARRSVVLLFPWVQLVWCVPLLALALYQGRREMARGMARAAGLTFVIAYAYWLHLVGLFAGFA